jgi:sugar phosphate isomerase/epimerase
LKASANKGEHQAHPYTHITGRCFVHVPFTMLRERLDWVVANRLQPEIGLEGETLYTTSAEAFADVASRLHGAGLACTLHAPFFDLAPGGLDSRILLVSQEKLHRAFDLLPIFQPRSIVCHLGYEANKHGYHKDDWLARSYETWQALLQKAAENQTPLMLENTYESSPDIHHAMLTELDSPWARFCLDIGHVSAFAKGSWQDWLPALEPWLGQLHLHDNRGDRDGHLPVGAGSIDFTSLFNYLKDRALTPLVTLEPHSEEHLWQTLKNLDRLGYFDTIDETTSNLES